MTKIIESLAGKRILNSPNEVSTECLSPRLSLYFSQFHENGKWKSLSADEFASKIGTEIDLTLVGIRNNKIMLQLTAIEKMVGVPISFVEPPPYPNPLPLKPWFLSVRSAEKQYWENRVLQRQKQMEVYKKRCDYYLSLSPENTFFDEVDAMALFLSKEPPQKQQALMFDFVAIETEINL